MRVTRNSGCPGFPEVLDALPTVCPCCHVRWAGSCRCNFAHLIVKEEMGSIRVMIPLAAEAPVGILAAYAQGALPPWVAVAMHASQVFGTSEVHCSSTFHIQALHDLDTQHAW